MKKIYIVLLSLILLMLTISCVSAGFLDGLFGGNDGKNITLIKESTRGGITFYDDGSVHAVYSLEGVLKDLPNDIKGYDTKVAIYDENKTLAKEDTGYTPMEFIKANSEKSEPAELAAISTDEYVNVSIIELKVYDSDGKIVFDKNITFSMKNVEISHYNKTTSDSSDSSDSDDNVTPPTAWRKLSEEELNEVLL